MASLPIRTADGAFRACQSDDLEPGMVVEELHEALTDRAGSGEDSDGNLSRHSFNRNQMTQDKTLIYADFFILSYH